MTADGRPDECPQAPQAPQAPRASRARGARYTLRRDALDELFGALRRRGFRLVGPVVRDGAICCDDIASAADLPAGWTDEQDAGKYRLRRRDDDALFGYNTGPQSWKKYLFPPRARLWPPEPEPAQRLALIGVRACELRAIAIQDRVFLGGRHPDPDYAARRREAFIVAVNCGQAGQTCFCASMDAGPRATSGFDLALTEFVAERQFLAETGTERGAEIARELGWPPASAGQAAAADALTEATASAMGRAMPELDLRDLLYGNLDHPRWDDVASRCLACGNCTMVCPTCFCFSIEDVSGLTGEDPQRRRSWDSCFTVDHSYLHGGAVRTSVRSRYRQWMTHKLASWADQFGTPGCVGCGRCITWCPAGIDITEEVAAIAADS